MKLNKIFYLSSFSLVGFFSINSFATVTTQTFDVTVTNNYVLKAVLTQECPQPSTYLTYSPDPASALDSYAASHFVLSVSTSSAVASSTSGNMSYCSSAFGWQYYSLTYTLYNSDGSPDTYHRACEFEYYMQGTSCQAYGKTIIDPNTTAKLYCNASATYSDNNTCTINFSISDH